METVIELGENLSNLARACDTLDVPRSTLYRALAPDGQKERKPRPASIRALPEETRAEVLEHLHSPVFVDRSPTEVFHTLLDQGVYLASIRTIYRILAANNEVRERRNQLRHPKHKKPELIATGPKQVWTWDITKLKGPEKWVYYHLYVVLDIYSRYVVGWMLAPHESGSLAKQLLSECCQRQNIGPHELTIHSDRGPAMQSKPVVNLLAQLDVRKSNSRPHVSNDNPFSEAQFKTVKYHPDFPSRLHQPA